MLRTLVHCATGKIGTNITEGKKDKKKIENVLYLVTV
jgi:hypothetical protein